MNEHTAGNWTAIKPEGAPYWGIQTDAPQCTVAGTASGLSEADAKLCARAPRMLAALEQIKRLAREGSDTQDAVGEIAAKAIA